MSRPVALITGAFGGIGTETACRLAATHDLALHGHEDFRTLDAIAQHCKSVDARVTVHQKDLAHGAVSGRELVREAAAAHGKSLHALIHNAAATAFSAIRAIEDDAWQKTFAVNVDALRGFLASSEHIADGGRVVTVSTANVRLALPGSGAYSASKAAAETLALVAARELGKRQITSNVLRLGLVDTLASRRAARGMFAEIAARTSLGRAGSPREIGDIIAFLCSPASAWMTGSTLIVDGGL